MEINGTLFAQMVHFCCAYVIVDRILLRPVIARIQSDDRKQQALDGDVLALQRRIDERKRYNEQDWIILQKRLRAECPEQYIGKHMGIGIESYRNAVVTDSESDQMVFLAEQVVPSVVASITQRRQDG